MVAELLVLQEPSPAELKADNEALEAFEEEQFEEVFAASDEEAYRTLKMTAKVPPAFDGMVQTQGYFAYEGNVKECLSIAPIGKSLRGQVLRNRLIGGVPCLENCSF